MVSNWVDRSRETCCWSQMRCSRSVISCLYHAVRGIGVGLPRLIIRRCQGKVGLLRPFALLSILAFTKGMNTTETVNTNSPSIVATPIDATAKEQVMKADDDKECTSSLLTTNHQSTSTCDVAPPEEIPLQEEVDNSKCTIPTGKVEWSYFEFVVLTHVRLLHNKLFR